MTVTEFLTLLWRRRKEVAAAISAPVVVEDLTPAELRRRGAEGVILDHDGILAASRAYQPDEVGVRLIDDMLADFGEGKVFVLSNSRSRREARATYFAASYPQVPYVIARRKPDPEGFSQIVSQAKVPPGKLAMVDDGPLTGVLMALEAGAIPVYALRRRMDEGPIRKLVRLVGTWPQILLVRVVGGM